MLKGYTVGEGFRGFINGTYKLFATEDEYVEEAREENGSLCESVEQTRVHKLCSVTQS